MGRILDAAGEGRGMDLRHGELEVLLVRLRHVMVEAHTWPRSDSARDEIVALQTELATRIG